MKRILSNLFILLLLCTSVIAQDRTVTGTIKGKDDGLPLPGVSVRIKGTTVGTQTGSNGQYSIKVTKSSSILVFTYVGYTTQEVSVGSKNVIDVSLGNDAKQLGEVVITALGVSRERKSIGYAATTVGSEEINRASPGNLAQGLQGKVAGVDISNTSGSPGGSSKVVLRGFSSITGNNQPLYVVDGVPINNTRPGGAAPSGTAGDLSQSFDFGNGANDINPNDIESVNILKGAAATSLYGSRGSSGVILITTKRGKGGDLKIDLSSSAAFTNVSIVPELQTKFGQGWDGSFILSENGSWGPALDGQIRPWGAIVDNSQLLKPFVSIKNNFRDAFDTGTEYNNTLSISGGSPQGSTFFLSYGNLSSDGVLPTDNDSYKRNSLSLNGSTKYKAFTASASMNYVGKNSKSVQTGQGSSSGANFYEEILQIPVDLPISDFKDYKNTYFNVDNYFTPFAENPYYSLNENGSTFKSNRVYGNVDLKYKAFDWLTFQIQQGADITNANDKIWHAKNEPSPGSWNAGANVEGYPRAADVGDVVEGSERYFEYDSKVHAIFDTKISSKFQLNGLVGLNFNDRGSRVLYTSVENLTIPGFYQLSNSLNSPTSTERSTHRRLLGVYGTATLGYDSFAYLSLNARNDWSSTLPQGDNSFFYPGANLALVLSDAFDMSSAKVSLFKLRASWGQTGSDTDPYRIYDILRSSVIPVRGAGTTITFPIAGVAGFDISNTINNAQLKPEISTETEFGTELRFFNNRVGLDLAYYNKITDDQILPIDVSPSSGYNFAIVNFGKVRNRGIELAVNGTPIKSKNFTWDIAYTYTKNRNIVLELPVGLDKVILETAYDANLVAREGQPLGVFEAPVAKTDPEGRIVVNQANGMPEVGDDAYYGSIQRKFTMGLSNSFTYKAFNLGFTLDYRKGGVFYSGTADLLNFVGNDVKTTYNNRNTFIVPNSVAAVTDDAGNVSYVENTVPVAEDFIDDYYYTSTNRGMAYNNRILDKTFFKLRDVTLSYSLPKSIASRLKVDRATFTVYGRNLYTWLPSGNRTIDPEVSNYGNDLTSEFGEFRTGPSTRSLGAALKVTF
ncbi:SusC/RagA family TonB-linked outer membrane protein [Arcticibacter eurypsychrophilus]|uniref:SusC/RagA family TonB-linked outer membrane protein n=1 Tax=Arcticibacter eurypsychrophilus TaxID=1434752 RepID=UPI00084D59CB|nr:SusC/RagA family TonB-linked outer membrane protein [Arcticibacter eurypsychrophilus]